MGWCQDCGKLLTKNNRSFLGLRCSECSKALFKKIDHDAAMSAARKRLEIKRKAREGK